MPNNLGFRSGQVVLQKFRVESTSIVEPGDMVYLDETHIRPASELTWNTDLATTQADFANVFVGIAHESSTDGEDAPVSIDVSSSSVYEFDVANATYDNGNPLDMGTPPIDLGKLEVDKDGNVVGAQEGDPNAVATQDLPPTDTSAVDQDNQTASLNTKASDGDQYRAAYEQVLAGDYASAEAGFSAFIAAHPESKRIADANFWLGEAQYSQAKYSEAAKTFLNAYKTYGKSEKAPEMLLKLAMSLAALDSRDTACATLREVSKAYPKASRAIITKVASEQKRLSCG